MSGLFAKGPVFGIEVSGSALRSAEVRSRDGLSALLGLDSLSLPSGIIVESFTEPNIADMPAFVKKLGEFARKGGRSGKRFNVALHDNAARAVILEFDTLPGKQEDTESMLRWRFKKLVPFAVEKAELRYQYLGAFRDQETQKHRFLAAVIKSEIIAQYESAFAEAGLRPDRIDISSFAVWNLYHDFLVKEAGMAKNYALMNVSGRKMSVMVFERGIIRFIRTKDLGASVDEAVSGRGLADVLPRELHASLTYFKESISQTPVELVFASGDMDGLERVATELSGKAGLDTRMLSLSDAVQTGSLSQGISNMLKYSAACGAAAGW